MSHTHELPALVPIRDGGERHRHSYVPTGIAMVNTPLGTKPVQVMMCSCGHVRAVYLPKPVDQEEVLREPAARGSTEPLRTT